MAKLVVGINDLATLHPEVAAESDGWDPSGITSGVEKKMPWKCKEGHTWKAAVNCRAIRGHGCPFCTNRKVWEGFNDLQTKFPEIAKEADGWDPSTIINGSNRKLRWKCELGHTWEASVVDRTSRNDGCPFCSNHRAWAGFNDLQTKFPEIAKEADGWDPTTVIAGSHKKMLWKCALGHLWEASLYARTTKGSGCIYCTNQKVLTGFNDLQTKFPEIAKEADGWDPKLVNAGSKKRLPWKCSQGHTWQAVVGNRTTIKGTNCPVCANKKLLVGFNDLQAKFPEIAKEADGWDPTTVIAGTSKNMPWKCNKGHTWRTNVDNRSSSGSDCPVCANKKVWAGFNDCQTRFPEIAKEAYGWDPSTVLPATIKKMPWKCSKGHKWKARVANRTQLGRGCPQCAEYGFNPGKPAWFYLMGRNGQQQFGITNYLSDRMKHHASFGWVEIETTGPHPGDQIFEIEKKLKQWLKKEIGVVDGTTENWFISKMEVHSLAELKENSGIETSIF